ncbi:hypothetical protein JCM33374_g1400 [Metschnikowia sp. JCM 33374]|nr:hypothetical protein JCM33374_g1400 [Metschnikowia sp. JCM 33374]
MLFFMVFAVVGLALSKNCTTSGVMSISDLKGEPTQQNLFVPNDYIFASHEVSVFTYSENGTLEKFKSGTYLNVNDVGQLVMEPSPHPGFSLVDISGPDTKAQRLYYKNSNVFYLCRDKSVDFRSACEGARPVAVVFQSICPKE